MQVVTGFRMAKKYCVTSEQSTEKPNTDSGSGIQVLGTMKIIATKVKFSIRVELNFYFSSSLFLLRIKLA